MKVRLHQVGMANGLNSSTRLRENGSDSTQFHQGSTKKQIAVWSSLSCFSLYCVKRVTVHQFSLYCVKRGIGLTVHFPFTVSNAG